MNRMELANFKRFVKITEKNWVKNTLIEPISGDSKKGTFPDSNCSPLMSKFLPQPHSTLGLAPPPPSVLKTRAEDYVGTTKLVV